MTAPLPVDAAAPRPRPGVTAASAGVGTVRDAVVVIDADFCILVDAGGSISLADVAGLDDFHNSRRAGAATAARLVEIVPGTSQLEVGAAPAPPMIAAVTFRPVETRTASVDRAGCLTSPTALPAPGGTTRGKKPQPRRR